MPRPAAPAPAGGGALPLEVRKPVGEGGRVPKTAAFGGAREGLTGVPASPPWGPPLLNHHPARASSKSSAAALG